MNTLDRNPTGRDRSGADWRAARRSLIGFLAGVVASLVVLFLSLMSTMAGHGSGLPYIVFVFPSLYGLLVWPLVGLVLGVQHRRAAVFWAVTLTLYLIAVSYHACSVYRGFLQRGIEGKANLFTVLAVVFWAAAMLGAWLLVLRGLHRNS